MKLILGIHSCSARCPFCYAQWESVESLCVDNLLGLLDKLPEEPTVIEFSGAGEPLEHPKFARMAHAVRYLFPRARLQLVTNGQFGTQDTLKVLREAAFSRVWVSLNAVSRETKSIVMPGVDFEKPESFARAVADIGLSLKVSFVVTKDNVHEVEDFVYYGRDLGAEVVVISALDRLQSKRIWKEQSPDLDEFWPIWNRLFRKTFEVDYLRLPRWKVFAGRAVGPKICDKPNNTIGMFRPDGRLTSCCYAAANHLYWGNAHGDVATQWEDRERRWSICSGCSVEMR